MVTREEALNVKQRYEDYYIKIEQVTGISVVNNTIVIYVKEITPQLISFLPTVLDGVPVRIEKQVFQPLR